MRLPVCFEQPLFALSTRTGAIRLAMMSLSPGAERAGAPVAVATTPVFVFTLNRQMDVSGKKITNIWISALIIRIWGRGGRQCGASKWRIHFSH